MDQVVPSFLWWPHGVLTLVAVAVAAFFIWRQHADTQALLRRWRQDGERQRRLTEIRDRLSLEGLSAERRAQELEWRRQAAERERRAREILALEEAARGDGADARG
jgi:ribosomal protein S21